MLKIFKFSKTGPKLPSSTLKMSKNSFRSFFSENLKSENSKYSMSKEICTYTSCYCEENIYKLTEKIKNAENNVEQAESTNFPKLSDTKVLFLSNSNESFPIWKMTLGEFVMWDYHVILFDSKNKFIFDLDSTIPGFPVSAETYFKESLHYPDTFDDKYVQYLRVVDSEFFLRDFASDRSHMKACFDKSPPPKYDCILNEKGEVNNLDEYRKFGKGDGKGEILTRDQFYEEYIE